MALYYSTRAINLNAGLLPTVTDAGSQISFTAPNLINTTQNDFITKGFRPGRVIEVVDGGASTNAGLYKISSLTAGVITVDGSGISTEAAAVDTPTINQLDTSSWLNMFQYGVMGIYSGTMPSDINGLEGGTLLALVTNGGNAHTPGSSTNGLEFEFDAAGKIQIKTAQDWREDAGLYEAAAGYGIIYDNGYITGDDSSNLLSPRIMGYIGLPGSDADIIVTTMDVTTSTPFAITQCDLTLPGQACS